MFDDTGCKFDRRNLYTGNEDEEVKRQHRITRFKLIDFGSTRLGVESVNSDLDLLVTTFDCLFERLPFFHRLEARLKTERAVENFVLLKNAHIPLAKFTYKGISVDIVFADMATPYQLLKDIDETPPVNTHNLKFMHDDYLLQESSVHQGNIKSSECLNGYLQSQQICERLREISPSQSDDVMRIFSEATVLVKCWATKRGIYNFNLGYLNGITIMIMVARAIIDFFHMRGHSYVGSLLKSNFSQARQ